MQKEHAMGKWIFVCLVIAVSAFSQVMSAPSATAGQPPLTSPPPSTSATGTPLHTRELLWQKLSSDVTFIQQRFDGVMGLAIRDLTDGRELLINADDVFPTASSIKIAVIAELYRQSQTGQGARLSDLYSVRAEDMVPDSAIMQNLTPGVSRVTNRDLAGFVVAVSDNAATNVLIDRVGLDNVNRMLDSLGLRQTRLRRKMMDLQAAQQGRENVSTPREMTALLESIYRGKLLNQQLSDDFFKLLSTTKDSEIPRLLPEEVKVADKHGALDGVRTDSGIVFLKDRPFVISVMTSYARDERDAENAISDIALQAFRYFETVSGASEYGRRMR
jgi:beta-lactamase class A